MKKAIKWTIFILLVLGAAGYGYWEMSRPLQVSLLALTPGALSVSFRETGTIAAAGFQDVHSETALTIREVHVEEGQHVTAGDALLQLDPEPLTRQLALIEAQIASVDSSRDAELRSLKDLIAQQEIELAETKRRLSVAQTEQARVKQLHDIQSATLVELEQADNAVLALNNAVSQLEKALSQLRTQAGKSDSETDRVFQAQGDVLRTQAETLRAELEKAVVTAPASGIVTEIHVKAGQPAAPSLPLLRIMTDGPRHIAVFVRAEDLMDIHVGMTVEVIREGRLEDRRFPAEIREIAPTAEERLSPLGLVEKRVKVELTADNLDDFVAGTDVDVVFTTHQESGVIVIPKAALFSDGNRDAVWVADNGTATLQHVETGLEGALDVVVTEGLSAGDWLVRDPNVAGLVAGKRLENMVP